MWIDHKYIGQISVRLDKFVRKGDYLYNFRCPLFGDSQTNRSKARGYIFAQKGGMFYKCHNCSASTTLGNLIKAVDPNLYKEYCLERYKEGETGRKPHKEHGFVFKPVKFGSNKSENFKGILVSLSELDSTHEAIVYANKRRIPIEKFKELYFVDNVQKLKSFSPEYETKIVTEEPRIVFPFYDDNNELVGLSCRGIRGEKQRYLVMRIKDDLPMLFNMNNVNKEESIYVTEGAIDSLFLPNAVAVGNSNLKYAIKVMESNNLVLVYDNEPRNKEIVREMKSAIDASAKICIWPKSFKEKDINEMILAGKSEEEILKSINKNTFQNAEALLCYNEWRMV